MKILIVEPDPNRQRQLRTILASLGHKSGEIETASDAKNAMSNSKKKRFDCAFIAMGPPLDAIQLVKDLKTGTSKSLPVIVYSADVTKENVISAAEAGALTFLAYPFSVSDVELVLKQAAKSAAA